ncbi:MAG: flagellar biosynthesis protein FlgN [Pseudonocardiales bacterium]|nr:MAG: flagellar biosynthesis protein FlgN [Pseudonocardiales bacterium]
MGLDEVSSILWREREMLELLVFKLEEEQLVLAAGRTRWLARATHEVEMVLGEIRKTELLRAVAVDAVAAELSLRPNPSLTVLADAAPEPWHSLLIGHRRAFLELTAEVSQLAEGNHSFLTRGQRATTETLLALGDGVQTYGPQGGAVANTPRARLLDEAM